jgi:hypothetical protein
MFECIFLKVTDLRTHFSLVKSLSANVVVVVFLGPDGITFCEQGNCNSSTQIHFHSTLVCFIGGGVNNHPYSTNLNFTRFVCTF